MSIKKFENDKLSNAAMGNLMGGKKNTKQQDGGKDQFKTCHQDDGNHTDYRYKKDGSWGDWTVEP